MINKKRLTPEQERKYTAGQSFPDSPYGRNIVPLHKIATPKYFDGLTETELKDILKNYSFEITGELQKHDLKYKVLQLWNVERKKGSITPLVVIIQMSVYNDDYFYLLT